MRFPVTHSKNVCFLIMTTRDCADASDHDDFDGGGSGGNVRFLFTFTITFTSPEKITRRNKNAFSEIIVISINLPEKKDFLLHTYYFTLCIGQEMVHIVHIYTYFTILTMFLSRSHSTHLTSICFAQYNLSFFILLVSLPCIVVCKKHIIMVYRDKVLLFLSVSLITFLFYS